MDMTTTTMETTGTTGADRYTIQGPRGTVVVQAIATGWTITGTHRTGDPAYGYTAQITACGCDRPYHPSGGRHGCPDWHAERVRQLAERTARTYRR